MTARARTTNEGNTILTQEMRPIITHELACVALDWEEFTTCIYQEDHSSINSKADVCGQNSNDLLCSPPLSPRPLDPVVSEG